MFKTFNNLELIRFVNQIIGLNKNTSFSNSHDERSANRSGKTVAIVLGVISEKIKMTIVRIIEPNKTFPPKKFSIMMVTIAEAKIFAKLFPTNIADKRISGRFKSFRAFAAPLELLDKFLNLTLFDAIIPVSDPEEKAEKISNTNKIAIRKNKESANIN
jgi:small nuclear ribonucleoprotein (snRNP)-like protein